MRNFVVPFLLIYLWCTPQAFAADGSEAAPQQIDNDYIINTLKKTKASIDPPKAIDESSSTAELLSSLAKEVDSLNSKLVVERASLLTTQTPKKVRVLGRRTIFNYLPDSIFEITSSLDHITDIELAPGEKITKEPASGDTVRWKIGVLESGKGSNAVTHIILKPLDENIETNLVIATDARVYHLKVRSSDWHMPSVSWNYPQDSSKDLEEVIRKESEVENNIAPEKLNFNYTVQGDDVLWKPLRVFDDGSKTYLQMPPTMATSDAPALFLVEDDNELLTNYRVKGTYFVIDRLLDRAELRVGKKQKVSILSGRVHRSFFERLFD